jgi:SHS2 domain-containing protein
VTCEDDDKVADMRKLTGKKVRLVCLNTYDMKSILVFIMFLNLMVRNMQHLVVFDFRPFPLPLPFLGF